MRSRLIPALVVVLLTLTLVGQGTATAADPPAADPRLPDRASDTARERAEDALARAQALFQDHSPAAARRPVTHGGRDGTMVLNELMRTRGDLTPEDRKRADALLARPTDGGADPYGDGYQVEEEPPVCGNAVCIHYVATPTDAPPMADGDGDGVPDSVEAALETAESVHATYTGADYRAPDPDAGYGGNNKVDIYLADVGADGLYGYCASDQPPKKNGTWNYWAYCVIDNDFHPDQFGTRNTPAENQQVTLAHEYFHAIQFAYDASEDRWFMEATATWAEDELFDDINDNRQYLPAGQLRRPWIPLDRFSPKGEQYGNWIFMRYLTERWSEVEGGLPILVRELIEQTSGRAGDPDMYSTQAIHAALVARGTSFTKVYGQFADANRRPGKSYTEGSSYRAAAPAKTWRLRRYKRSTGPVTTKLNHLTSIPVRFKPGRGTRQRDWRLRVKVDMPPRKTAPVARLSVYLKSGKVQTSTIQLNRKTHGAKAVPFSSRKVKYVELVLVNASRRTECWQGTTWACQGKPRDNRKRTDFRASIFRR